MATSFESLKLPPPKSFLAAMLAVLALLLGLAAAPAQTPDPPKQRLASVQSTIADINTAFSKGDLSDADLLRLRTLNDPLAAIVQGVIDELAPKLEASQKRLLELTPKAADRAIEVDSAGAQRAAEQITHDDLDSTMRSARALLIEVDETNARIGSARRALFAEQTFQRASSLISPFLWIEPVREARRDQRALRHVFGDWLSGVSGRLTRAQALAFIGFLIALAVIAAPIVWVARRVVARDPAVKDPSRLRRAAAAGWTALVLAGLPMLALLALVYGLDYFDISDPRLQGVEDALFDGLRLVVVTNAITRGLLAPGRASWRLIDFSDGTVDRLIRLWVGVAAINAAEKLIEAVIDAIGASLNDTVAARAIGAALVALLMARSLRGLTGPLSIERARAAQKDPASPGRTVAWAAIALIVVSLLAGYIAFADFFAQQILRAASLAAVIFMIGALIESAIAAVLAPGSGVAEALRSSVGLSHQLMEQLGVLIEGVARIALIVSALVLIVAPWGIQSQDLFGSLRTAYFGFKVGDLTISISSILAAAALFIVGVAVTRGIQGWLAARLLPLTRLDSGLRNSIKTFFGYVGFIVALVLGLTQLGVSFEKLTLVAGALSVGIGFGLQGIVNNFLSGIIILWERAIRVGDMIVVGTESGFVQRINVRSTEIETFDRATLIVPNATMVSGVVKNWVRVDRVGRILLDLNIDYDSDPEQVREIIIAAAKAQDLVLAIPAPMVLFNQFGDWAMKFQLICFVDEIEMAARVQSDINFDLHRRLKEAGVRVPRPQTDVEWRGPPAPK
jgi:small-conductance mechanosensitive channel